jgi:hypothetical protein
MSARKGPSLAYQFLKHAVVQLHLRLPTLEEVMVVVLEALPVCVELLQAVRIDVLDSEFFTHLSDIYVPE